MKRFTMLKAAALAAALGASASVNSPSSSGYLERGRLMLAEGNWQGCLDQVNTLSRSELSAPEAEQAAWLAAAAAYAGGRADAAAALEAFLDTYPGSALRFRASLCLANALLSSDPARALGIYDGLAGANAGTELGPDLEYHRAYALLRLGELEAARAGFAGVASDAVYGPAARFYLGYLAYCDRDYSRAVDYFNRTDRRTLPGAAADYYLAQIHYVQGDYGKALAAARALIDNPVETDPAFAAEALRIAGESLFHQGDTRRALPYLEQYAARAEHPEPGALYILGTASYDCGDYDKAVRYLTPVTADDSAMGQSAYLFIGESLMSLGDKDAALMAFDNALRGEHDEAVREAAYYNYAVAKFGGATMPFGSSVATFEDFLRRYPDGPYTASVQEYLVAGYLTDHDYDTALASINRMSRPGDKVLAAKQQILYALGTRALAAEGDRAAEARDYLAEARTLARHDRRVAASVELSLGEALYRLGDYEGAAAAIGNYLAQSPADDPNRALGYYDLGYARFAAKDYRKAGEAFGRFVKSPGRHDAATIADACNRLGDVALYGGDLDAAAAEYARAFESRPSSGDYPLFQQAVIKGYRRDYSGKIAMADRFLETFPTSALVPDMLLEKAEGYIQLGRKDDAVATYRRLLDEYPATAQGRSGAVQLAMTLLGTGDRAEAIEAYRDVIRNYPTSDEAMVAVEELQRLAAHDGTLGQFAAFLETVENAPQLDISQSDRLSYEAAEEIYVTTGRTDRLEAYVNEYPTGAYRAEAWSCLMEAAVAAGRTGDSLTFATLIIENTPDTRLAEDALAVKAAAEHSLGRGADALATWQQLAARASTPALQNLARAGIMRVARDLGDYDMSIAAADALLASSTAGAEDRNEAVFARALALDAKGETAAAREAWSSIAPFTDDINGVKSAYYLAQCYFDGGDTKAAADGAEAIIDSSTPHTYWLARAFILLSDVFEADGKKFEAREYLRSLRDNYPGSETDIFQMIDQRLTRLK